MLGKSDKQSTGLKLLGVNCIRYEAFEGVNVSKQMYTSKYMQANVCKQIYASKCMQVNSALIHKTIINDSTLVPSRYSLFIPLLLPSLLLLPLSLLSSLSSSLLLLLFFFPLLPPPKPLFLPPSPAGADKHCRGLGFLNA